MKRRFQLNSIFVTGGIRNEWGRIAATALNGREDWLDAGRRTAAA
jgi:hypothetical protein